MPNFFKLPFPTHPLIGCYGYNAIPLAIVQGNASWDAFVPWICSKVGNCVFMENVSWEEFALCTKDPPCKEDGTLKYAESFIYPGTIKSMKLDVLNIYKLMLRNGYYFRICYSSKFIPTKQACATPEHLLDTILYGYDDVHQKLFLVDYYLNSQFTLYEMSYKDYYNAMLRHPEDKITYQVLWCNPDINSVTKTENIMAEFSDYVLSTSSREPVNKGRTYGMASMRKLKEYFTGSNMPCVDFRYTQALMEHKRLLTLCVPYLEGQGLIAGYREDALQTIYDMAQQIYLLGNEINRTKNSNYFKKMGDLFDQMIAEEEKCFHGIL